MFKKIVALHLMSAVLAYITSVLQTKRIIKKNLIESRATDIFIFLSTIISFGVTIMQTNKILKK
jgi:hypothetical protein